MKNIPIAISGCARSGKDSFAAVLIEELNARGLSAKRFALADSLKDRVNPFLKDLSGIDIWNCSPKDKELARDLLVAVGKIKRAQSEGKYWTASLEKEIQHSGIMFPVITDIRYDVYPEDEIFWAQEHMGGVLVHISRYETSPENPKKFLTPPNKDEAENDPKLKAKADYVIEWPTYSCECPTLNEHIKPYITDFINWLGSR